MADIAQQLREYRPINEWGDPVHHTICDEAALEIERLRTETDEDRTCRVLATITPPDNGTAHEVLSAVLACANAWVPEARIIGNVRAGDIARVIATIVATGSSPSSTDGGKNGG